VYQGSQSPNNLLLTSVRCYNGNYQSCAAATVSTPISETDAYSVLANGSTNLSRVLYNGSFTGSGLVSEDDEYDYGVTQGTAPGTSHLIRQTVVSYAALGNGIVGLPASVTVNDWTSGSSTNIAKTTYAYDGTAVAATSGTPQHIAVTGSRGNLTTLATSANIGSVLYQTFSYYDTGNLNTSTGLSSSSTSPGPTTTYSYGSGSCGNSFATSVAEPLGLGHSAVWNCFGGVKTSVTDENTQITWATYSDPNFWRPTGGIDQSNNTTTVAYASATANEAALNFNGGNSISGLRSTIDPFGRPILSQVRQGPGALNYDTVETDYNSLGQPSRWTLPFSATAGIGSGTAPGATATYDALGRPQAATDAGGGAVSYTYTNNDVLITVSGPQTFKKLFELDGLGRLASVCEISATLPGVAACGQTGQTGYWTKYTYDALGRILTVTQNAQASSGQQTRTFQYDLIGRHTAGWNPETGNAGVNGKTSYTYDVACTTTAASPGDLTTKIDNAGHKTCFGYDALHRLTDAGNSTVCRRYRYDNSVTPPAGVSVTNTKTRLLEAKTDNCGSTQYTDEWFSYSVRGELVDAYESTPHSGGYYHTSATYWPSGAIQTLSGIPSVPTLYFGASNSGGVGLDGEGRYTQVTASTGPNPITNITYSTSSTTSVLGAITGVTFGSGDSDAFTYDPNTGRQKTFKANVNGVADTGTVTWNSNGTLGTMAIADGLSGTTDTQSCSYTYDDLGRVGGQDTNGYSVDCGSKWQQLFTYDGLGNIVKSGSSSFAATYSSTTNQFALGGTTVQYDGDGNLLSDNLNTYTWDPNWGDMTSVNGITATYNAFDQLVELQSGSSYAEVLYSPVGKVAIMNGASLTKAFVPLPGGGTAVYNASGIAYYRHPDWLGSSRIASTQSRTVYSATAYAPFGEQYASSGTADASFTDQSPDTVPSLYDFPFRRYSPSQGRWISPDPAGVLASDPTNPQSWNRYAYVLNNPLLLTDPTGLCPPAGRDGRPQPCGGGGEGDGGCTMDGVDMPCGMADAALESGGALECPGNDCGPYTGSNGFLYEVIATAEGWSYINPKNGELFQGGSELGLPALPDAEAMGLFVDPPNAQNKMIMTPYPNPANAVSCTTSTGVTFLAPPGFSISNIAANGATNGWSGKEAAVGQFGYYDYQRYVTGPNTFNYFYRYTPVANIAVGAYLQGAGYAWAAGAISDAYAWTHSANGATAQQAQFRNLGIALASGKATYTCQSHP
jgi:RHS repeat-associated protein